MRKLRTLFRVLLWAYHFGAPKTAHMIAILVGIIILKRKFDTEYYLYAYPEGAGYNLNGIAEMPGRGIHPTVRYAEYGAELGNISEHISTPKNNKQTTDNCSQVIKYFKNIYRRVENVKTYQPENTLETLKCSVIIPTYNRKNRVIGAIQSALTQTKIPHEILVCDDGSEDDTYSMLKEKYTAKINADLLRIFRNEHQGAASARNLLLREATGELIAYLDSDVSWFPDHLSSAINLFVAMPDASQMFFAKKTRPDDAPKKFTLNRSWLLQRNYIDLNSYIHRRELYEEYGGFDEDLKRLIDYDLIQRYSRESRIYCVPRNTYHYTLSEDSISVTQPLAPAFERIRTKTRLERVALKLDLRPIAVAYARNNSYVEEEIKNLRCMQYDVIDLKVNPRELENLSKDWRTVSLLYIIEQEKCNWPAMLCFSHKIQLPVVVNCDNINNFPIKKESVLTYKKYSSILSIIASTEKIKKELIKHGIPAECIYQPA